MTSANYDACISKVLQYEGGYTTDPNDSGNWTGCAVGAGTNKGTNRGISACSYPNEDIKGMTEARAKEIYRKDYWQKMCGDDLPAGPDLCTMDGGVNSGPSRGVKWLQKAVGATEDGVVGPQTIAAANAADDHVTIDRACNFRLDFLRGLSTWPTYGKGWSNRVEDVRKTAHGMVSVPPEQEVDYEMVFETVEVRILRVPVTLLLTLPKGSKVEII
jgi:lysozyme family protein